MNCAIVAGAVVAFYMIVVHAPNAWAYIDMGSGSYLIQIVIASILGTLATWKFWRKRAASFLKGLFAWRRK